MRIGVGHPGHASKVLSWVLSRAAGPDEISIHNAIERGLDEMNNITNDQLQVAMTRLHTKPSGER